MSSLISSRLTLRPLEDKDWNTISFLRSDTDVNTFIERPTAQTQEDALAFIHKIKNGMAQGLLYYWAICLTDSKDMIGTICLWNFSEEGSMAEIGYDLHPTHQGKGYMTEALEVVLDFGFSQCHLQTIEAYTHRDNQASTKLLLKQNFQLLVGKSDPDNPHNVIYALKTSEAH